ncbi:MAG: hypothetical protein MR739_13850 [Spirochaetia bacterium]|nr:hypothetical protein [Spirochaetia bacterium]
MLKIKNKYLYIIIVILIFLYVFSFIFQRSDKRKSLKSTLINPSYVNEIEYFELFDGDKEKLIFQKNGTVWEIHKNYENNIQKLPAESTIIKDFFKTASGVVNMYKISDTFTENNSFMILKPGYIQFKYTYKDKIYEIYFGAQDFSLSSRFVMSGKSTDIYEISNFMDKYLTTSVQFWCDSSLISQNVFGKIKVSDIQKNYVIFDDKMYIFSDLQKLLDLRHGGFISDYKNLQNEQINENSFQTQNENSEKKFESKMEIFLELGNKNQIHLNLVQIKDNSFVQVESVYQNEVGEKFVYNSQISLWTYNKIKEITL